MGVKTKACLVECFIIFHVLHVWYADSRLQKKKSFIHFLEPDLLDHVNYLYNMQQDGFGRLFCQRQVLVLVLKWVVFMVLLVYFCGQVSEFTPKKKNMWYEIFFCGKACQKCSISSEVWIILKCRAVKRLVLTPLWPGMISIVCAMISRGPSP